MTREEQRQYDHERYVMNNEQMRDQRRQYYHDYFKHGKRKPRSHRPRSIRDHERYLEKRDEILEKQRIYRVENREEINRRRRQRYSEQAVEKLRAIYQQKK